jgi:drug/metabolite transporter (DMT)-like permease
VLIGTLSPAAYLLVLWAMSFTPLVYVASAREVSILFGAALGTRLLGEGHSVRRLLAAGCMVCGLVTLATA